MQKIFSRFCELFTEWHDSSHPGHILLDLALMVFLIVFLGYCMSFSPPPTDKGRPHADAESIDSASANSNDNDHLQDGRQLPGTHEWQ